jgi:hypothetical protein
MLRACALLLVSSRFSFLLCVLTRGCHRRVHSANVSRLGGNIHLGSMTADDHTRPPAVRLVSLLTEPTPLLTKPTPPCPLGKPTHEHCHKHIQPSAHVGTHHYSTCGSSQRLCQKEINYVFRAVTIQKRSLRRVLWYPCVPNENAERRQLLQRAASHAMHYAMNKNARIRTR